MSSSIRCLVFAAVVFAHSMVAIECSVAEPNNRDARMAWWRDARFGMFIHWGIMSLPGKDFSYMERENIPVKEYEKLVSQYNPVEWDAESVVRMAKQTGQRYLVFVAKHHDGFCMWDSKSTNYDIMSSPYRTDIVKELAEECRRQGIVFCVYYSILDWHHPDAHGKDWPKYVEYMKRQLSELLTEYGPIGAVWFDGEWAPEWTDSQGRELADFVWSLQPATIINNRVGRIRQEKDPEAKSRCFEGDFETPEQEIPPNGLAGVDWESCMTINNSWSWNSSDDDYKSERDCVKLLVDTASRGGNLLLNIGPEPDGRIPELQRSRMAAMQKWMEVNHEAIYGSSASPFSQTFEWGRCTVNQDGQLTRVYFHVLDCPKNGRIAFPSLANEKQLAYALADKNRSPLALQVNGSETEMTLPQELLSQKDFVLVLECEGRPQVVGP